MRPLLVGEVNPYGVDPAFALYPLPEHASGWRLCAILGMSFGEYLSAFNRVNLCSGRWSIRAARAEARVIAASPDHDAVVLLGAKVCAAFGVQFKPFQRTGRYAVLPHPSGRCRLWNDKASVVRARRLIKGVMK